MRFLLVLLLLLSFATVSQSQILVQGHRGARAERPENTLAAFRYALEVGVDVLELDVVISKDNSIVISHDPHLNTGLCIIEPGKVKPELALITLNLAQIQQFDCGSLPHPRFPRQRPQPGEKIPSLRELFEMIATSHLPAAATVNFNIETKIFPATPELTPNPEQFSRLLLQEVATAGVEDRVIIQSFDPRTLVWVKKLKPEIKTSLLTGKKMDNLLEAVQSIGADYASPQWTTITAAMVRELHDHNIKVAPWTANTEQAWDALIEMNVDEIITDDPKALIRYLKESLRH